MRTRSGTIRRMTGGDEMMTKEEVFNYRCNIYLQMTELLLKNAEYEE